VSSYRNVASVGAHQSYREKKKLKAFTQTAAMGLRQTLNICWYGVLSTVQILYSQVFKKRLNVIIW
jgi:hypothetical protein